MVHFESKEKAPRLSGALLWTTSLMFANSFSPQPTPQLLRDSSLLRCQKVRNFWENRPFPSAAKRSISKVQPSRKQPWYEQLNHSMIVSSRISSIKFLMPHSTSWIQRMRGVLWQCFLSKTLPATVARQPLRSFKSFEIALEDAPHPSIFEDAPRETLGNFGRNCPSDVNLDFDSRC